LAIANVTTVYCVDTIRKIVVRMFGRVSGRSELFPMVFEQDTNRSWYGVHFTLPNAVIYGSALLSYKSWNINLQEDVWQTNRKKRLQYSVLVLFASLLPVSSSIMEKKQRLLKQLTRLNVCMIHKRPGRGGKTLSRAFFCTGQGIKEYPIFQQVWAIFYFWENPYCPKKNQEIL